LAINPATPVEKAWPFLGQIDELLVMTVHPGFGGQAFLPEILPKIRALRSAVAEDLPIIVDGGINPETGRQCVEAGANVLVAGNSLFRHKTLNLVEAIAELRKHATD
jgi:ribulose-phosphate 3-epimerase